MFAESAPSSQSPRPSYDDFFSSVHYPYHAALEQQRRIERAARILRVGWTEQQVLARLGPPDYKTGSSVYRHHAPSEKTVVDQYWHYVHSMEQQPSPDQPGRLLIIGFSNGSTPRRVVQVDGNEIPGLKPQNVPKT
jgi:hypothetical protein